jgi:tRNA A-37 threonylcarbamoyl transferase component Bud32/dienelactone hydrolase
MIGRTVSHYEIVEKLGEGGMGVVYKARDTRLHRFVALKFLPAHIAPDDAERFRFLQEARTASALDHPNICTIHDIAQTAEGQSFIVMACYEGETLAARLARGPLPVADAIGLARQVADGMSRAHERGIVHRDLKPANIFITTDGAAKILDFGIARLVDETRITREGTTLGTLGYMAPEQARAEAADQRADVWAVGVILYEMLAGRVAFPGDRGGVVIEAILTREPAPLETVRPDAPAAVVEVVRRALRKDREERFPNGGALATALTALETSLRKPLHAASARSAMRTPMVAASVAAIALALLAAVGWLAYRSNRARWARNEALPQIAQLAQEKQYPAAVALAERAERYVAGDPVLRQLWKDISATIDIDSTPAGALVEIRPYAETTGEWRPIGTAPIRAYRIPRGVYRFRFSREGSEPIARAARVSAGLIHVQLPAAGTVPAGMVLVPKSAEVLMMAAFGLPREIELADFYVQRHEVTNREYKAFMDAGGYRRKEFWTHEFVRDGRTLSWDEALAMFRDKAGQPGPATWEVGAYPTGDDDIPVGGLSWFEADAYARFAGLSLPTVHHWYRAASIDASPFFLPLANFDYRGPMPVGRSGSMSPSGVFDMAGNVKEWTSTTSNDGRQLIVGGGWGEPQYLFGDPEGRPPFDRSPLNGVRLVKYSGSGQPEPSAAAPWPRLRRDFRAEPSVPDETFAQFVRMHEYPATPLDARIEKTLESDEETTVQRVTFAAAYPGERVIAYVWLPRGLKPPYQTIVVFPGAEALRPAGGEVLEQPDRYDFLVRSGRAVVHPVYRGMYERFKPRATDLIGQRDDQIRWSQDFRRTIDYLVTRADIDASKIAYFGGSLGASFAPVPLATEPRVSLAILVGGGFPTFRLGPPETSPINFAPRVKVPLLLLCGRHDFFFPYETSQKPFFERIGTPADRKKHVTVDAAHSVPRAEYLREMLAWLDRFFGPAR